MDTLRGLTEQISVFVRFFESINYLFCQIRWLEQNIQNSSKGLLLVVGTIGLICFFVYYCAITSGDGGDLINAMCHVIVSFFPIIMVVALIGYFLLRRLLNTTDGELGSGTGFDNVLFGSQRRVHGAGRQDDDIEGRLLPTAHANIKTDHR